MYFVGKHEYVLDRKRVPIPPVYRSAFAAGGYVTTGIGPYLVLHTLESWEHATAVVQEHSLETEDGGDVYRDFFGNAAPIAPDGQGRVQLSDQHIHHAGLERDVLLVGVGERFEIWDRATYEADEARRREARRMLVGRPTAAAAGGS